jgi:hypothetical protein
VDRRALEPAEDAVAQGDRVGEVLESHSVLRKTGYGENARPRAESDHEALVADLERPGERVDDDRSCGSIVARDVTEQQLRVWTHLA